METQQVTEVIKQLGFIEQLQKVTLEITDKVIKAAPEAVELLLTGLQIRATVDILFTVGLMVASAYFFKTAVTVLNSAGRDSVKESGATIICGTCMVVFIVSFVALIFGFVDSAIMAINPEAGLALMAFDAVMK